MDIVVVNISRCEPVIVVIKRWVWIRLGRYLQWSQTSLSEVNCEIKSSRIKDDLQYTFICMTFGQELDLAEVCILSIMLNRLHSKLSIHTIILQQYLSLNNYEIKMIDRVNFSMTIMNDIWKTHLLHFKRHSNLLNICIKFILFLTLCYNDHFMHLSQICMLKDIHVN